LELLFSSPDSSENPFCENDYFFVKEKKRPEEALFYFTKKEFSQKDCNGELD
jgi:hypothetical protein